jgi:hypothetical protein
MAQRIQFIEHRGKKILVEDFSNLKAGPEFISLIGEAQRIIASQPPKSVRAVFDASGSGFNSEVLNAMKNFTNANTPYIKAAAVVGINGLLQVALTAISKFAGREFIVFKSRFEAMDWLVEQD